MPSLRTRAPSSPGLPGVTLLAAILAVFALALAGCSSSPNQGASSADGGGGNPGGNPGGGNPGGGPDDGGSGANGDACVPVTCASVGASCGTILDGCGGTVTCATCASGESCGGGGTANVCGPGTCAPTTCLAAGKNCGQMSDGCASVLTCGSCAPGATCGAGGANVCGTGSCTATTCAAQGKNCGSISDGCSGLLVCGACSAPDVCGIGAQPNVCAVPCPEGCPSGFTCNGAGECAGGSASAIALDVKTVAVSGTVTLNGAAPTASAGCSVDYGVANVTLVETTYGYSFETSVACASNTWSLTVYPGTYKAYVQGVESNLPGTSYAANAALAVTAPQSNVALDVKTVTASGTVTLNGAAPVASAGCSVDYGLANVTLVETTYGYTFEQSVACAGNAWSLTVYPGTYKAYVAGVESNLPGTSYAANAALAVTAPQSNVDLDVKTVTASGTVTLNGAAPVASAGCSVDYGLANVTLVETTYGYSFEQSVACAGNAWSLTVYPGTYKAYVAGVESNLPGTSYVANAALAVTSSQANVDLDVKTVSASGTVTLNGAAPVASAGCDADYGLANVTLVEATYGYTFEESVPCDTNAWSLTVYPGTYKAYVAGVESNLPGTSYVANAALAVTASPSNVDLDVKTVTASGTITLNGAAPTANADCSVDYGLANVTLVETTYGYSFEQSVACAGNAWNLTVYPGTYKAYVQGVESNLPGASFVANPALAVTASQSGVALDVETATVGGTVTVNGAPPVAGAGCSVDYGMANVTLVEVTYGYSFETSVACAANTWSETVYPGTYKAYVQGVESNIPGTSYVAVDRLLLP